MEDLVNFSAKIKNFKCFGDSEQGFEQIKPINLIIGRNNSGKSSLSDLVKALAEKISDFPQSQWHNNCPPEIILESPLTESEVRRVFRQENDGGGIPGNHWEYGKVLVGIKMKWNLKNQFISIDDCPNLIAPLSDIPRRYRDILVEGKKHPLRGKTFKRLCAERNIFPEPDSQNLSVDEHGRGATNIIQNFINKANKPSELVEKTLLDELNHIFRPDGCFIDIVCQQIDSGAWEIYLEEESKGRVSLSNSGSGIQTIILVLIYLHLVPVTEKKNLSEFVFAFEELENNLHPGLLRRLLTYLHEKSQEEKCIFFLTTHSNVAIDFFGKNEDAQIIHVTHNSKNAICRTVKTYIENMGILDDLDVRASDLLQSNCVIWVEGPSDRIYINKWIDLWTGGKLREGTHYQCVFYGGRLLSHLNASDPDAPDSGIAILRVNRKAIILLDSDKRNQQTPLNLTKKRIIKEIEDNGGIAWVTKGKEIENYIPAEAVEKLLDIPSVPQVDQHEDFFNYLNLLNDKKGTKYPKRKTLLAESICQHLTKENINQVLDLGGEINLVCEKIRAWNP